MDIHVYNHRQYIYSTGIYSIVDVLPIIITIKKLMVVESDIILPGITVVTSAVVVVSSDVVVSATSTCALKI